MAKTHSQVQATETESHQDIEHSAESLDDLRSLLYPDRIGLYDGAGALTSLDSFTTEITGSGDWVVEIAEEFSGIVVSDTADAGEAIVLEVTKAASGIQLPACLVALVIEKA